MLTAPELQYGGNCAPIRVRTDNFTWQGRNFLIPGGVKRFACLGFLGSRDRLNNDTFK